MKHATQLAFASVAAFALSAQASDVTTFNIDFSGTGYTVDAKPRGSVAGGTWSGDASGDSKIATTNSNPYLLLDTESNDPLVFTPTATNTVTVKMDVKFVPATTPQDRIQDTQVGIYSLSNNLMVSVNGGSFADSGIDVSPDHWYTVQLDFNYTGSKTISVSIYDVENSGSQVGSTYTQSTDTTKSYLEGIDFYGSGSVDNFVGEPAAAFVTIPTSAEVDGGQTNTVTTSATLVNGTLTTSFDASVAGDDLQFITVKGTINGQPATRTLRVTGTQDINIAACGFTSISGVTAHYGDVTATTGNKPEVADTSVAANGTVSGSVAGKSGLYYAQVVDNVKTALHEDDPIAPEDEGKPVTFTVSASRDRYGVVKFKIVASDAPVNNNP